MDIPKASTKLLTFNTLDLYKKQASMITILINLSLRKTQHSNQWCFHVYNNLWIDRCCLRGCEDWKLKFENLEMRAGCLIRQLFSVVNTWVSLQKKIIDRSIASWFSQRINAARRSRQTEVESNSFGCRWDYHAKEVVVYATLMPLFFNFTRDEESPTSQDYFF